MENNFDVVIVSAWGRGHWLAQELAMSGLQVALVDVSSQMGKWTAQDWEGPFGVFRHGSLSGSQSARLEEDASLELVENGLTLWPKRGPLELHSRLTPYLLSRHQVDPDSRGYLEQASRFEASGDRSVLRKKLQRLSFENSWLCHWAHQFAANIFTGNADALSHGEPVALFSDWFVRRPSGQTLEDGLQSTRAKGVRVFPHSELLDIGVNGGQIEAIEIKNVDAGLLRGRYFVWTLSSEDAARFEAPIAAKLFPAGVLESEWAWVRYQIRMSEVSHMQPLPLKFVLLENLFLPWAHANMSVLNRTQTKDIWDAWVRIPTQSRFQRGYLEKIASDIVRNLSGRVPGLTPQVHEMPLDYTHNLDDIGAPRFPVFNQDKLKKFKLSPYRNFYFAGPEAWSNLDWGAQFAQHGQVANQVRDLWTREREREQRRRKS